jgi:membrane-bound transcription factor site-1 protease
MYQYLKSGGYFIEILGSSYNCFDPLNYGTLLIIDTEEEFHQTEIEKIHEAVTSKGLSLIVFADWYNSTVIKNAKFYDENTRKWWIPVTGGANVPALNDLLGPFGIAFGDKVYEGEFNIGEHSAVYASGTSIIKFPSSRTDYLVFKSLNDQGHEFLMDAANLTHSAVEKELVSVLGLHQSTSVKFSTPGRIAVYGDSNCLDSAHRKSGKLIEAVHFFN